MATSMTYESSGHRLIAGDIRLARYSRDLYLRLARDRRLFPLRDDGVRFPGGARSVRPS